MPSYREINSLRSRFDRMVRQRGVKETSTTFDAWFEFYLQDIPVLEQVLAEFERGLTRTSALSPERLAEHRSQRGS